LRNAAAGVQKAANAVVKATQPGSKEDPANAIADSTLGAFAFKANATVLKTADKMLGALLDTIA